MSTSTSARTSSMCNGGAHKRCAAAQARCDCACHGPRGQQPPDPKEPAMPATARSFLPQPAVPTTPARPGTATKVELRRCDPPACTGRGSTLQRDIDEALAAVRAEPGVWFQVVTWPGKSSAGGCRRKLGAAHPDIDFRAVGGAAGSALYAKARP